MLCVRETSEAAPKMRGQGFRALVAERMLRAMNSDCCSDRKVRRMRWTIVAAMIAFALVLAGINAALGRS